MPEACSLSMEIVVPYVGTWIEIAIKYVDGVECVKSFPTWERG